MVRHVRIPQETARPQLPRELTFLCRASLARNLRDGAMERDGIAEVFANPDNVSGAAGVGREACALRG